MPIYRDKARGCYVFEFDRLIEGQRVRARKLLPKAWSRTQADAYDRKEGARLYAIATRVQKPTYSIEDAVAIYLKERVPKLKSGDNITGELAQMFWAYKDRPMTELPEVCREYAQRAVKSDGQPLAAATLRNRIRYLTSACRYAWKHHNMAEHDPGERVASPAVSNARMEFLDRKQMLQIARACPCRSTRAAIRRAFYSGMRMAEIIRAQVVGDNFDLRETKNGSPRLVPIHPRVRCTLSVPLRDRFYMSKQFKAAARACGMGQLRFHDLRHSAASAMINNQVDLYTVGAVLGHKSSQSTQRYSHLATASLRDALSKIGRTVRISPDSKTKKVA